MKLGKPAPTQPTAMPLRYLGPNGLPPGTRRFNPKKDRFEMPFKRGVGVRIGDYHFEIMRISREGKVTLEPRAVQLPEETKAPVHYVDTNPKPEGTNAVNNNENHTD